MTKTQLSERSGVSRATIDRWRTGTRGRDPQAPSVNAVADVLGIDRPRALRLAGILTTEPADAGRTPAPSVIDEKLGAKAADFREAYRVLFGADAAARLRDLEEALSQPPADDRPARPAAAGLAPR